MEGFSTVIPLSRPGDKLPPNKSENSAKSKGRDSKNTGEHKKIAREIRNAAKKEMKLAESKSKDAAAVEAPTPSGPEPAITVKKKKKKKNKQKEEEEEKEVKKNKKGLPESPIEETPEQDVQDSSGLEAKSKQARKEEKRAKKERRAKKKKRHEMELAAQEKKLEEVAEAAAVTATGRSSKKRKHENDDGKPSARKEKSHKKNDKSDEANLTNGSADQWNPNALSGDAARKQKFLRLLGAGKTNVAASDGAKHKSSANVGDIAKVQSELERQYEAGMKLKHDGGAKRRGLGA